MQIKHLIQLLLPCFALLIAGCSQVVSLDDDDNDDEILENPQVTIKDSLVDIYDTVHIDSVIYYDKDSLIRVRDTIVKDTVLRYELDSILNIIDTVHVDTIVHTNTISYVLTHNSTDTLYRLDTTDYIVYVTRIVDSVYKLDTVRIDTVSLHDTIYWQKKVTIVDSILDTTYVYYSWSFEHKSGEWMGEFPYYSYTDGLWPFEDWSTKPSYYYSEMLDSAEIEKIGNGKFPKIADVTIIQPNTMYKEHANDSGYFVFIKKNMKYLLSFDKIEGKEPPILRVTVYKGTFSYIVKAIERDNRWYYPLDSNVIDYSRTNFYFELFEPDYSIINEKLSNFIIATGFHYSLDFTLNLVVAGKYTGTSDNASLEVLAQRIKDRLDMAFNPGGVTIKQLNILYAKDHPSEGAYYPETDSVVFYMNGNDDIPYDIERLSKWPGHEGEFFVVLGHSVADYTAQTLGFSPMPGNIYTDPEDENNSSQFCVATHRPNNTSVNSRNIADVVVHELGHFFGLKHTTEYWGEEDNLEDTPACPDINKKDFPDNKCPDFGYIMFPMSFFSYTYSTFTPQQMDVIRTYLATNEHK